MKTIDASFYDSLPLADYPEEHLETVLAGDYRQMLNTRRLRKMDRYGMGCLVDTWFNRRRRENEALANSWAEGDRYSNIWNPIYLAD